MAVSDIAYVQRSGGNHTHETKHMVQIVWKVGALCIDFAAREDADERGAAPGSDGHDAVRSRHDEIVERVEEE
eukprot:1682926-Rhodomonas_salina.1